MAEQTQSVVQEGVDRFNAARERFDEEFNRVQKRLAARRKRLERQLETGRKRVERETRKQVKRLSKDLRSSSVARRFDALRDDLTKQIEETIESVLDALQVATKSDVRKIDRKLGKINKRLREIERSRTNGAATEPPQH